MFFRCLVLLYLVIQLCFPQAAFAQTTEPILTPSQRQELIQIQHHLTTLNDLHQRRVITDEVVRSQQQYYLEQAAEIAGQSLTLAQLESQIAVDNASPQGWQRIQGFFTFVNIALFTASLLLVVAVGWLCHLYVLPLLMLIPPVGYEIFLYILCLGVVVAGRFVPNNLGEWIALPGCFGYVAALAVSQYLHGDELQIFYDRTRINLFSFYSFQLCLFWTVVAIVYQSSTIGFLAVIALESLLGFTVVIMPLHYMLGFTNYSSAYRATAASFMLLAFYLSVKIFHIQIPYFAVFAPGLIFMGAFVYYIGLLILSSRKNQLSNQQYIGFQVLTICSGIAALFIGSFWEFPTLRGIGGTFFFLYLLEKYFELPWQRQQWAWATLGLALILYSTSLVAKEYPQYFLFSVQ